MLTWPLEFQFVKPTNNLKQKSLPLDLILPLIPWTTLNYFFSLGGQEIRILLISCWQLTHKLGKTSHQQVFVIEKENCFEKENYSVVGS